MNRRDLLGALLLTGAAPALIRHARAADVPRFALGVASGSPQPDGVVLWTRLTGEALPEQVEVRWELALDEGFNRIAAQGTERAVAADAHSVHAEPAGLQPGRWYWYRFTALGQRSGVGRTRTTPAAAAMEPLKFAIASCQRWDHGHYAAWRHLAADAPDLVLFLGDYIYEAGRAGGKVREHEGGVCRTLADYRARYAQYKSDPALQAAHAAAPWLLTWDDHEVANDYAGFTPQSPEADFAARRAAAYQAYWEHQPLPKALRPVGPDLRLYGHRDWGALTRLLLVDERQYRDPQACRTPERGGGNMLRERDCAELADPRRSLLGAAQESWLAQAWSREHRWNLLGQQTLMTQVRMPDPKADVKEPGATQVWSDGWQGYAPARQRLLQTVAQRQVPGCVVLGGDVHATYVADLKTDFDAAKAPVIATEFCGTSITSHGLSQKRMDAIVASHPHVHYGRSDQRGYLAFELDAKELRARVVSVDDPNDPASGATVSARFVVEAGQAGAQRTG